MNFVIPADQNENVIKNHDMFKLPVEQNICPKMFFLNNKHNDSYDRNAEIKEDVINAFFDLINKEIEFLNEKK